MKKLTILFDADDTVENLSDCWIAMLNERYGISVTPEDVHSWDISLAFPTLTKEQVFGVLHDDELWRRITPISGSVEVLQKLYDEGHQLYMVTASSYHTCKTKVERLLELFPFLDWEHIMPKLQRKRRKNLSPTSKEKSRSLEEDFNGKADRPYRPHI